MKILVKCIGCAIILLMFISCVSREHIKREMNYTVAFTKQHVVIDANWEKPEWKNIEALEFNNYMEFIPDFRPEVKAKMMYNNDNLFVIFQVHDKYVHSTTTKINGPVYEDSCVEFFFAPDTTLPKQYFNLEVNSGGIPLMYYNIIPRKEFVMIDEKEINEIEIAHSLPEIVDREITEPVTWVIEFRIPITILEKYSKVTRPQKGVEWRANFHKIAETGSNPHYLTWSLIDNPVHDFHLPQYFGKIMFD